ncbi:DUF192 domain-containing protein [Natronomonas salsuginis]|jgi:uncharacterized membrane protein (UPF0127 family)|uniref:DUF192 domain-containing protein n=1 Tax=Natronomonas salsuginis TaxID=2217661 RepID=A0A4U5J8W1_9EURY|nr:DUF192 domain-containing protein [Natronomonas salsuginis]TKR24546.1 DUF192 domain-containing protein [Natronomonas salsuginis]
MDSRWLTYGVAAVAFVLAAGVLAFSTGAIVPFLGDGYDPAAEPANGTHDGYKHTTVTVHDADSGEELGHVEAAIADTSRTRYLGLSATDDLPENRGMLFVHDGVAERTYVMRNMSFGIDIVFADADGTITTIHEAPEPAPDEDGNAQEYPGTGQYVLEVNRGWMAERGVEVGDEVRFDL